MRKKVLSLGLLAGSLAVFFAVSNARPVAQNGGAVRIDADDIGGVVTGTKGPEAGVWVIAETTDLPTKTDQDGRHR